MNDIVAQKQNAFWEPWNDIKRPEGLQRKQSKRNNLLVYFTCWSKSAIQK